MGRRTLIMLGAAATVVFAGCYASTEPATDIGPDSATLNARGTANNGPARSYFEYSLTGRVGDPRSVGGRQWPAGASGPFSAKLSPLASGTSYSFRVCGFDEGSPPICAQTRTFTTKPPVSDSAWGSYWSGCCSSFSVDAKSGPSGENPQGAVRQHIGGGVWVPVNDTFDGYVTCLAVDGPRAAIGAVGAVHHGSDEPSEPVAMLVEIVDGRTAADEIRHTQTPGSTPPDCDDATFDFTGDLDPMHEFVVNDAAP